MGIYYLESGAVPAVRSKVIYDRAGSAIAQAKPGDIDWDKAFEGATWFHITGITPAHLSEAQRSCLWKSVKEAKKRKGIHVSCDLNYRKNLWKYGKNAKRGHDASWSKYVDAVIANEEDCPEVAGPEVRNRMGDVEAGELNVENIQGDCVHLAMETYPNIKRVAITLRESDSLPTTTTGRPACTTARTSSSPVSTPSPDIVDRVGGGDSLRRRPDLRPEHLRGRKDRAGVCCGGILPEAHDSAATTTASPSPRCESLMKGSGTRPRAALSSREWRRHHPHQKAVDFQTFPF